jgi:FkbM family methyltransferase
MTSDLKRWWGKVTGKGVGAVVELTDVDSVMLGTEYGGHAVCPTRLTPESVIYSVGVGEDISFDLELIERYGVTVHAFDPTPRSIAWIEAQSLGSRFKMHGVGVADYDGTASFAPPPDPTHISHTLMDRPETEDRAFEVPVKRLQTLMAELGHTQLDVLKMDIEGAEYGVLEQLLAEGPHVPQILVEFHHQFPSIGVQRTRSMIETLHGAGYRIFSISDGGHEYSFLKA